MGRVPERLRRRAVVILLVVTIAAGLVEAIAPGESMPIYLGAMVVAGMSLGPGAVLGAGFVTVLGFLLGGGQADPGVTAIAVSTVVAVGTSIAMDLVGGRHGPERSAMVIADMVGITVVAAAVRAGLLVVFAPTAEVAHPVVLGALALHATIPGLRVIVMDVSLIPHGRSSGSGPGLLAVATGGVAMTIASGDGILLGLLVATAILAFVAQRWGYPLLVVGALVIVADSVGLRTAMGMDPIDPGVSALAVVDMVLLAVVVAAVEADRIRDLLGEREVAFRGGSNPALVVERVRPWRVLRSNDAARRLFGDESLEGGAVLFLLGEEAVGVLSDAASADPRSERARIEQEIAGLRRVLDVAAARITLQAPLADLLHVEVVDVTDLVEIGEQLTSANQELHQVAQTIAHDLAQPLSSIVGYANTLRLRHDQMSDDMREQMLAGLVRAASGFQERMSRIVADAAVAGRAPATVELRPLLSTVTRSLSLAGGDEVVFDLGVEQVVAEPSAVGSVVGNLLDNALKHRGAEDATVTVRSRRLRGGWLLQVLDNGRGIPVARLHDVLRPGVRLEADVAGGGSGLAAAAGRAERAGCELDALPRPDGGRFELWIPDGSGAPPLRVLIAEQDDTYRAALRELLDRDDRVRDVGEVARREDLHTAVVVTQPDVLLLDRSMGGGEAIHDLPGLRGAAPSMRTIVLSPRAALAGLSDLVTELGIHATLSPEHVDDELLRLLHEAS